jgi:sugar diacid utilization regulator
LLERQVELRTKQAQATLRDNEAVSDSLRSHAARDMQTLRRTAALQIQLLELVIQQKEVGELIERVATLLDMPIVLFDTRGHAIHCSPGREGPHDLGHRLWTTYAALQGPSEPQGIVDDSGHRVYYRDIEVLGRIERVLAAVAPDRQPADFADAALSFLQQLVTLDVLRHRDELSKQERSRQRLLRDVLAGRGEIEELRAGFADHGIPDGAWRIVAMGTNHGYSPRQRDSTASIETCAQEALQAVAAILERQRIPYLAAQVERYLAVLSAFDGADSHTTSSLLRELRAEVARVVTPRQIVIGCSAPMTEVTDAPRGFKQAQTACIAARRDPTSDGTVLFDELSGQFRLLDGLDEKALADIVTSTFAPLHAYDAQHRGCLYETLHTLFEHHLVMQETADALHVHRNTLLKRLGHIEELLGINLAQIDDVVDVQLGLHAAELLGAWPD